MYMRYKIVLYLVNTNGNVKHMLETGHSQGSVGGYTVVPGGRQQQTHTLHTLTPYTEETRLTR